MKYAIFRTESLFVITGVLSWMSVIYLDVVKSRIQADDPVKPYYKGTVDCFKKCYKVRVNFISRPNRKQEHFINVNKIVCIFLNCLVFWYIFRKED